jgi:hypothetical protein
VDTDQRKRARAHAPPPHTFVVALDRIYAYGCGGYHDAGFGCLYRCVQTLRHHYRLKFRSVQDMLLQVHDKNPIQVGRDVAAGRTQDLWAEPSDARALLPELALTIFVYARGGRSAAGRLLAANPARATLREYDQVVRDPYLLRTIVAMSLERNHPLIVDDKTSVYVVYGLTHARAPPSASGRCTVLLADPHNPRARTFTMPFDAFASRQWMVGTCCPAGGLDD